MGIFLKLQKNNCIYMKNINLIIGAATGYKKNDLYYFVESVRKVYKDKVIFIVNDTMDEETNHYFNKNQIEIFLTKSTSRTIFKDRYEIYKKIIENHELVDKVMLSDTRDVIFQSDPFKNQNFSKLNFFLEDKKIFECDTNSKWIKRAYGKKIYDSIKNENISCSGVSIGDRLEMLNYTIGMTKEIRNNKYYSLNPYNKGSDQGNHNVLVNLDSFKHAKKIKNHDAFIVNMSNSDPELLSSVNNKLMINEKIISVVHQYNSHKKIHKIVDNYINEIEKD